MDNSSGWPLGPMWLWGLGPWGIEDLPVEPSTNAINLRPGFVVHIARTYYSIDGTPFRPATDLVTLDTEGFYEIDTAESPSGDDAIRHAVCIVDPSTLSVGASTPDARDPPTLPIMVSALTKTYPRGKVISSVLDRSFEMVVTTNKAVALEIRSKEEDGGYEKIGEALAKRSGRWLSERFSLLRGTSDLKLAVVFASQDIVLA